MPFRSHRIHDERCFEADSIEGLALNELPSVAEQILEALPIQIFVKDSTPDESLGRKYRYLNKAARQILEWGLDEVTERFDSEAFAEGNQSQEWREMFEGETETIESLCPATKELSWTAKASGREVWRINRVLEFPIVKRGTKKAIGFCSIAQDIEFKAFSEIHSELHRILRHEYGNLTASVLAEVERASMILSEGPNTGVADSASRSIATILEAVEGRLEVAARSADFIYQAVANVDNVAVVSVGSIVDELQELFEVAPYNAKFSAGSKVRETRIKKGAVIRGIISELVKNAEKHLTRENGGQILVEIVADGDSLICKVMNRCDELKGRMCFGYEEEGNATERFGSKIISSIVKRAFGHQEISEMLKFSHEDGWVCVDFVIHRGSQQ